MAQWDAATKLRAIQLEEPTHSQSCACLHTASSLAENYWSAKDVKRSCGAAIGTWSCVADLTSVLVRLQATRVASATDD
jgi:hypothetical protein